jgi:hypothetical protein
MEKKTRLTIIFILVYLAAILFIFLPAMEGDFLWDDKLFISENPNILGSTFLQNFLTSPFGGNVGLDENSVLLNRVMQFYRPMTSLSYWLDFKVWWLNPAGFHLTNILLHLLNTIFLYLILVQLGMGRIPAFMSGLLFALFPLHFENVSWITGRTDLLSFMFAALSVLFFITYFKKKKYPSLIVSSFFLLLALLSKENSLMIFVICFMYVWQKGYPVKKTAIVLLPPATSVIIWLILRRIALGSFSFAPSGRTFSDFLAATGFYSFKTVLPFKLSYTIDSAQVFDNTLFVVLGGILTLGCLILILILLVKRPAIHMTWQFGPVSFFLLLLPSVLVIFSSLTISHMGWRFLYLPSAVFVAYLCYVLYEKINVKAVPIIALALISLLYSAEIYPKNKNFGQSESDFWLGIPNIQREDLIAKMNIAKQLLYRNEPKALAVYNDILQQTDHHQYETFQIRTYEELASYYTRKKDLSKAEEYFNNLFQIRDVQSQFFYFTYANFLAYKGEPEEGEKIVAEMLRLFPQNHQVLIHAANFYLTVDDNAKAIELLRRDYSLFRNNETLERLQQLENLPRRP